ncbi:hypothetical protein Bpfe_031410 [Biomphalaria pfeifferi]|uniref:Uncharacterized protein n=1 Tax=Biomphalaria pfeifferi TaxID=112525 RepID=A0AAD8AMW8_BIOPF|nr:hypothetical protein Bpfe_031410 [Biomphalaria pfeifferi]
MRIAERILFAEDHTFVGGLDDIARCAGQHRMFSTPWRVRPRRLRSIGRQLSSRISNKSLSTPARACSFRCLRCLLSFHRASSPFSVFGRPNDRVFFNCFISNGGLQFGHTVIQRREIVVGIRIAVTPSLIDEKIHPTRDFIIVRDDDSAFARRHLFALLKRKRADLADRSRIFPVTGRQKTLRRVFDNRNIVRIGKLHNRFHLARVAEQMRDDDRLRFLAQNLFDGFRPSRSMSSGQRPAKTGIAPDR